MDYHINDHNALSGSYFFGNDTIVGMDFFELLAQFRTKVHSRAQTAAGHWAWTPSSTWANEFRGGFTHYTLQIVPDDTTFPYKIDTGISNPLLSGIPDIRIRLGGGFFSQPGRLSQLSKRLSGRIRSMILLTRFLICAASTPSNSAAISGGTWSIKPPTGAGGGPHCLCDNLEAFLAGTPASAGFLAGDPTRNISQWLYAGYMQDDWRITKKVTLNLGLRYEFQAVPTEANNLFGNWEPSVGFEQVGKNISSIYKPDHRNFFPRLGSCLGCDWQGNDRHPCRRQHCLRSAVHEHLHVSAEPAK